MSATSTRRHLIPLHTLLLGLLVLLPQTLAGETTFRATLSAEEQSWLEAHPIIHYAIDPNYAPIEFIDDQGIYAGMGADYLARIAERLGVRFVLVPTSNWTESLSKAYAHEVDMLPVTGETEQRKKSLVFTPPYISIPVVAITARRDLDGLDLSTMARTLKIAVVKGSFWEEQIASEYPEAKLVETPDIPTALQNVSFGIVDALVNDLATASYFIGTTDLTNLRVASHIHPEKSWGIAVRGDWPLLRDMLSKALANLSAEEKRAIESKWIRLQNPMWWHSQSYRLAAFGGVGLVLALILTTLAWNRSLARLVAVRTKDLEEAHLRLMQSAKLESVGRLAAGIAHEVKNPLAILQMGVDFLAADIPPESDGGEVIADMEDAINRADTVIKGLLDFSRERKLDMHPCDLNEVLKDSLKLVQHELTQHNITLVESLAPDLPLTKADPDRLKQVLINLLINAIQAMGQDGRLLVGSEAGKLRQLPDGHSHDGTPFADSDWVIRLKVEDSGPGIDPAKVGKVFEPFFTTKPVGQGTGLGLSVSRNIVELHGGTISLRNREGGGASAVLLFKINQE